MKKHLIIFLVAALLLAPSCRKEGPRVIPRGKLSKIYAEMLVTDQWIQNTPRLRTIADTSLVYEPILEKYGYSSEDYRYSVDHYMNDPERFSRILRSTGQILDQQIKVLKRKQKELQELEARRIAASNREIPDIQNLYTELPPYAERDFSDTLEVVWDSVAYMYRFRYVPRTDTIYEGVAFRIPSDSLFVADSLQLADSLSAADTLAMKDSVAPAAKPLVQSPRLKPTLLNKPDTVNAKSARRVEPMFLRHKRTGKDE